MVAYGVFDMLSFKLYTAAPSVSIGRAGCDGELWRRNVVSDAANRQNVDAPLARACRIAGGAYAQEGHIA